jgi:hypothetical protein
MHVDYWNYLGWKDEFSSPLFSERQRIYGQQFKLESIYTPQMIVDGKTEFVGGDSGKAAKAITEAARFQKGKIEIVANGDLLSVKISDLPDHEPATVFLAIAEDDLVSNVGRGENSGQRLVHQSVVRELKTIGALKAEEKSARFEAAVTIRQNWKKENLRFVIFVQENEARRILSAGRISAGGN